jgi:hypothetical protein
VSRLQLIALTLAVALCGCGDTHSQTYPDRARYVDFRSPVLTAGNVIPAHYRCGPRIWLPLKWGALPPKTVELALSFGGYGSRQIVAKGSAWTPIIAGALIVGLNPSQRGLSVGGFPKGAIGLGESQVPVCPPNTTGGKFIFRLFALQRGHSISRAMVSSESAYELLNRLIRESRVVGEFFASYGGK